MIVNELVYQRGKYWAYRDEKKGVFVICRDDSEKGNASVVGATKSWEVAKDMVDKAGGLK